jgi:hypothetical protein
VKRVVTPVVARRAITTRVNDNPDGGKLSL